MDDYAEAAQAAGIWSGLLLLLMVALSLLVVRQRQKHKVLLGHGDVPSLELASRAFGNAIEYVPAGMAGLALLVLAGAEPSAVHVIGAMLLVGRVLHAFGLSRSSGVSVGRAGGMTLTWLALVLLGLALIAYAVT
jgi:hypothetical protein